MLIRLLFGTAISLLLCSAALADDFWDTPWFTDSDTEQSSSDSHGDSDSSGIIFPTHSLSLATHGAYFGSGNEFLMGGGQVSGLGGVRHDGGHNSNHPTYGVYPEIQHLFEDEAGYMGPMWGVPDEFAPSHGETTDDSSAATDHATETQHRGNSGIIYDDDWWLD